MKKAKRAAIAGAALILSAVLLIAFTAFFSVFDFNRKIDDFVNTLPGNESDAPLPDEPETTPPGDSDIPDAPDNPSVTPEPGAAEAANATVTSFNSWTRVDSTEHKKWRVGGGWEDFSKSGSITVSISGVPNINLALQQRAVSVQFRMNIVENGCNKTFTLHIDGYSNGTGNSGSLTTGEGYVSSSNFNYSGYVSIYGKTVKPGRVNNLDVICNKKDTAAPTFSLSNGSYTNTKSLTISDSSAGINSIKYTYGNSGTQSTFGTYTDATNDVTFNFPNGEGKYVITATDNLGNSSATTIYYYNISAALKAYCNGTLTNSSDNKSVSTSGGTITTTNAVTGLNPTSKITYKVTINPGYVFLGLVYEAVSNLSEPYAIANGGSYTIQINDRVATGGTTHVITGYFLQIGISPPSDLTYNRSTKSATVTVDPGNLTSTLNTAPDKVDEIVNKLFPGGKADMTYFSLSYSGTTAGGSSWSDVPKYAGTYTPTVTCTYSNTIIGTYTGSAYTISPMTVYIGAVLDTTSKTYDGSKVVNASAFGIYEDARLTKTYGYDSLSYSGSSTITLNSANAGTPGFELTSPGNLKLTADNNDILKSYNAEVVTDKAGGGISSYKVEKRTVNIDAMAIVIKTGADTAAAFTGKVYDGTKALGTDVTAFVYTSDAVTEFAATDYPKGTIGVGIKLGNLVGSDLLSAAFRSAAETVYFTEPAFNGSDVQTTTINSLSFNVNATNYLKGKYNADSVSLKIEKLGIDASFGLAGSLTYDGSTGVSTEELTAQLNGVLSADNGKVSLSGYKGTLSDENAGSGRTITVTGYSLDGDKAGNYKLNNATYEITGVEIDKRTVTITPSYKETTKVYDGTTDAEEDYVSFAYENAVEGDADADNGKGTIIVSFTVRYSDKNAGSRDIIIEIVPHDNYDIAQTTYTVAATISAKSLNAEGIELGLDNVTYTYTGETFTPSLVTHTDVLGDGNSYTLIEGTDYTVNVTPGTDAGQYTVTVTGKGNYSETETVRLFYTIEKSDFTVDLGKEAAITLDYGVSLGTVDYYFNDINVTNNAAKADGSKQKPNGSYKFEYGAEIYNTKGLTDYYKAGSHTIKVVFTVSDKERKNFNNAEQAVEVTLNVNKADATVTVDSKTYYYAGVYDFDFGADYKNGWGTGYSVTGIRAGDEANLSGLRFGFADSEGFSAEKATRNAVGTYEGAITLTGCTTENYNVNVVPGNVTINALPVTLTPVTGQSKYYGAADPESYSYTLTTSQMTIQGYTLNGKGEIGGELQRTKGESAGQYLFLTDDLSSDVYALNIINDASLYFTINKLIIEVIPGNFERYFGEEHVALSLENDLTFSTKVLDADGTVVTDVKQEGNALVSALGGKNTLTITFNTDAIESSPAGNYKIAIANIYSTDVNKVNNFTFVYDAAGSYTIKALPVTVTANAVSKQYADSDPTSGYFSAEVNDGIEVRDNFNLYSELKGNLQRAAGEKPGSYAWNRGALTPEANPDFELSYNLGTNSFTITRREIVLQVQNIPSIVYSEPIPDIFGEDGSGDGVNSSEWSLAAGNTYYASDFDVSAYPTYQFIVEGGLKITGFSLDEKGRLPAGSYNLAADDVLSRYLEENSDLPYRVTEITGLEDAFTVETIKAIVYLDSSKLPTFTFGTKLEDINAKLREIYLIRNNLSESVMYDKSDFEGAPVLKCDDNTVYPTVGEYVIDISGMRHSGGSIELTVLGGQSVIVTTKQLTVKNARGSHEYAGNDATDSEISYEIEGEVDDFKVTGKLTRNGSSSNATTKQMNVGQYNILLGELTTQNYPNYTFRFDKTYYYEITRRPITVVPNTASSVYGDAEKSITYVTYYKYGEEGQKQGLLGSDSLGGKLSREGYGIEADAGSYEIVRGTLNNPSAQGYNNNYEVSVAGGVYYTIERKNVTVYASAASTVFGIAKYDEEAADKLLNITYSSAGGFNVSLLDGHADIEGARYSEHNHVLLPGSYKITQGTMTNDNNPNYNINFVTQTDYVVTKAAVDYYLYSGYHTYGEFEYKGEIDKSDSDVYFTNLVASGEGNAYYGDFTQDIRVFLTGADAGMLEVNNYPYYYEMNGESYYPGDSFETDYYIVTIGGAGNGVEIGVKQLTLQVSLDETELTSGTINSFTYNAFPRAIDIEYSGIVGKDDIGATEYAEIGLGGSSVDEIFAVGSYKLAVYTVIENPNYYIGVSAGSPKVFDIEITKAEIAVSASTLPVELLTKVYGEADPVFAASQAGEGEETVEFSFIREEGENVGSYAFTSVVLEAEFAANYSAVITESDTVFTVTAYESAVNPSELLETLTKVYGEEDPDFSATVDGVNGEQLRVVFERDAGEDVGTYLINGVSTENENYSVSLSGSETAFEITKKDATVIAVDASEVYDGSDFSVNTPELTFITEGFIGDDEPTAGALGIESGAKNVGSYGIVATEEFANDNYNVAFVGATFTVTRRPVRVESSAKSGVEFFFDPAVECFPAAVYFTYTVYNKVEGEELAGFPGDLPMQAGYGIPIPQGSLTNDNNPNYDIDYVAGTVDIDKITLLVTPEETSSVYGDADAYIPYEVVREDGIELPEGFSLNGALSYEKLARGTFADVGPYRVTLGTLGSLNPDYIIEFSANSENVRYTVTPRTITLDIQDATTVYGDPLKELTMVIGGMGLAEGDNLVVTLQKSDPDNKNVGEYEIYLKEGYAQDNPNYEITVTNGKYSVTPRPISVRLYDQHAEWRADGNYTVLQNAWEIVEGSVIEGDSLGITIYSDIGIRKQKYPLYADWSNDNYELTFNDDATFEVMKFNASISVPSLSFEFIYNGGAFHIEASVNSGADVIFSWEMDGKLFHTNSFTDVGRYTVTLSAGETEDYYAPENVVVSLVIKRENLISNESGIDIIVDNENGFNPETVLEVEKMDKNDKDLNDVISSNETIVRAFNITTNGDSDEPTSITVKVPEALKDLETVKVLVKQDGVYSVRLVGVENGYITIDSADTVSAFAFVKEEPETNYLMIILIGGAALILVVSLTVYLLKKKA